MERPRLGRAGRTVTEGLDGALLGRGGEGEEAEVGLLALLADRVDDQRVHVAVRDLDGLLALGAQDPPHVLGRGAVLAAVRLVHDHGEAAA